MTSHHPQEQQQVQAHTPSSIGMAMLSISSPRTPKAAPQPQQEQPQEQERPSVLKWRNGPPRLQRKVRRKSNEGCYIAPSFHQFHETTAFQTPRYQYVKTAFPIVAAGAPPPLRKRKSMASPTTDAAKENRQAVNNKFDLPRVSLKRKSASLLDGGYQDRDLPFFPSDLPDAYLPPTQLFGGANLKPVFDSTIDTGDACAAVASNHHKSRRGPLVGVNLIAPRPKKRMDTLLIF